jgi:predicted amidohydrolase YtcJ
MTGGGCAPRAVSPQGIPFAVRELFVSLASPNMVEGVLVMQRLRFLQACLAALGVPAIARGASAAKTTPADLIVTADTIHTVEPTLSRVRAFAVCNGRFTYVGQPDGALALRGPNTEIVNLREATVLPGLIDAHIHLTSVGEALHEVDLYHVTSFDEIIRRTVAFAKTSPDAWIIGEGWDQNLWPAKAFPTHDALTAAIPDRPVVLDRVDGHAILVNAKAMELAGITKSTPDPAGGRIVRDAAGNPTGVFVDNAADVIWGKVPDPTHDQLVRWTRAASAEANRFGVTAIGEANSSAAAIAAYEDVARAGDLHLRIHAMLSDEPELIATHLAKGPTSGSFDGRLSIRAIKMFADGALGSRGAALLQPYADDPRNVGLQLVTQAHITDVTTRALAGGFQTSVHAIGDRGNRVVLDAYEAALKTVPAGDYRLRVEHAQVLSPEDIPRFKSLGIIPSMQTTHQISDMGWAEARLGPIRVKGAYAWRSLIDTGVIIANGTDAPVEAVNSLRTFHAAISRQNEANQPPGGWYPDQKMTRDEALKSMTIWAAHANFSEHAIGSIAPGKYADFVVMDRDWMRAAPESIMQTRILATYSGGHKVYDGTKDPVAGLQMRSRRPRHGGCDCGRAARVRYRGR